MLKETDICNVSVAQLVRASHMSKYISIFDMFMVRDMSSNPSRVDDQNLLKNDKKCFILAKKYIFNSISDVTPQGI